MTTIPSSASRCNFTNGSIRSVLSAPTESTPTTFIACKPGFPGVQRNDQIAMKITFNSRLQSSAGYALMITLIFVTIALMGFGSIMCWMSSSTLVTERNNLYVSAQAAAESATEKVMTTMMRDFTYGSLNPVSSY